MTSPGDIHAVGHKTIFGDTAAAGPSLAAFGRHVDVTWTGTDNAHHLNVMSVA